MEKLFDTLPGETQQVIFDLHQHTGMNTQFIAALMVEYIVYQMYQLAPLEVRAWLALLPTQCAHDSVALPELQEQRIELVEICEMNNEIRRAVLH